MINWTKVKDFFKKIINGFIYILVHFEIGNKDKAKDIILGEEQESKKENIE